MPDFITALYLCDPEQERKLLVDMFRGINRALCNHEFDVVDSWLRDVDLEHLSIFAAVGLLSSTTGWKSILPGRIEFMIKVQEHTKDHPNASDLLVGL